MVSIFRVYSYFVSIACAVQRNARSGKAYYLRSRRRTEPPPRAPSQRVQTRRRPTAICSQWARLPVGALRRNHLGQVSTSSHQGVYKRCTAVHSVHVRLSITVICSRKRSRLNFEKQFPTNSVAYPQERQGMCSQISGQGTVMQTSPPFFDTQLCNSRCYKPKSKLTDLWV